MLPFFRKIRWRLAANNQFFKYSRYAVGEIVLVVIGILIALYINNWNENRKDGIKKLTFQKALIEDLKKDSAKLKNRIRHANERIEYSDELIYKMEKTDATIDTIFNLWFTRRNYLPIEFNTNKATFESLFSTGQIGLFSNEDISRLTDFYDTMELGYSQIRFEMVQTYETNSALGDKFGWLWKKNKESHIYKILRKDFDEKEFLRLLDLAVNKYNRSIKRDRYLTTDMLKRTDSLIKELNQQIE